MTLGLTALMAAFAGASIKAFGNFTKAEAKLLTALKGNQKAFADLKRKPRNCKKLLYLATRKQWPLNLCRRNGIRGGGN